MFQVITPIIYWVLIVLWSFILCFYVKKMWDSKTKQLFQALVVILGIDAFRTLFESVYFGLWYTSLSGLIPLQVGEFLTRPELVIFPKIINVIAAVIIIVLLLKKWLPMEESEHNRLGMALHARDEEFSAFFENNPLSCWLEDLSAVQKRFKILRREGIVDIDAYFAECPEELEQLAKAITIKNVNQATLDLHKAENREQLYQGLETTFTPESFECFRKEMVDFWNGTIQNSHNGVVKTLDGELRHVQINYRVLPGYEKTLEKVLLSIVDNTPRYLAEQKLLESENRFKKYFQTNPSATFVWEARGKDFTLINVNSSAKALTEKKAADVIGLGANEIYRDMPVMTENLSTCLAQKSTIEFEHYFKNRYKVDYDWIRFRMAYAEPNLILLYADVISDQKKAEAALKESEKQYQDLYDNAPEMFASVDPKTALITRCNQTFAEKLGYTKKEILKRQIFDFYHPDSIDDAEQIFEQILVSGETKGKELQLRKKNGSEVLVSFQGKIGGNTSGEFKETHCGFYDITEQSRAAEEKIRLEKQLAQAQKMESIGTLAGGIAHDFNNMLSVILGFTELAKEDCQPGSTLSKDLDEVLAAANRAKGLVGQILAFSRQAETERIPLEIDTLVSETIKMLRPALPATIEISQDLDSGIGHVLADPTQIHQILMNLCTNAFHAMEVTGGKLEISLKEVTLSNEDLLREPDVDEGFFIQLSVGDSGPGIAPPFKDRIFDPYFTTKEEGKGTGMGLSMVHGIVKSYGGFVSFYSELDNGTVFHVFLPVAKKELLSKDETINNIPIGRERILYVDDEELLVKMGTSMLERLGYQVTARTSSFEALAIFKNQPDQFDLVITDQTMPGMTGSDLSGRVLQIRPDIPIILCTGYSTIMSEEKAKAIGIKAFALKPLAKKDIATLIRQVLDASL